MHFRSNDDEINISLLEGYEFLRHARLSRTLEGDVFIVEIPSRTHEHAYPCINYSCMIFDLEYCYRIIRAIQNVANPIAGVNELVETGSTSM